MYHCLSLPLVWELGLVHRLHHTTSLCSIGFDHSCLRPVDLRLLNMLRLEEATRDLVEDLHNVSE